MNIVQHKENKVTIDGSGGIYIAHHSTTEGIYWIAESENATTIAVVNWTIYHQRHKSRLKRFFHLLPIIWAFTK